MTWSCLNQKNRITSSTVINITVYFYIHETTSSFVGYMLKFRSPNLYTIIIFTKIKKGFLREKRVKGFLVLWLCYHWRKLNLPTVRRSPANEVVDRLLIFLIVWILHTVNMVLFFFFSSKSKWLYAQHAQRKKSLKWTTSDKLKKFKKRRYNTEFSKLVNLCSVRNVSYFDTCLWSNPISNKKVEWF